MRTVAELNALLGRSLGLNPYAEPIYRWEWSEDLFWPAYATGGMVEKRTEGGLIVMDREYRRDRMSHKLHNQWVVTRWSPPESLENWNVNFPGADYPSRGYRIHTNASLPQAQLPSISDTEHFIACIREQKSMTFGERLRDMEAERDRRDKAVENEIKDEVMDSFTAFMNPEPGKRGGFVSFPDPHQKEPSSDAV